MLVPAIPAVSSEALLREVIAPTGLLITGVGIGAVWTMDLVSGKNVDMSGGVFRARDRGTNQVMWPHLCVEYLTATAAVVSAVGLYRNEQWAPSLSLVTSGLVAYTSINSMSWVLSEKGRMAYAIPMMVGLAVAGITVVAVF